LYTVQKIKNRKQKVREPVHCYVITAFSLLSISYIFRRKNWFKQDFFIKMVVKQDFFIKMVSS